MYIEHQKLTDKIHLLIFDTQQEHVLEDECQAYSIASGKWLRVKIPKELSLKLRKIYKKYITNNKILL